MLVSQCLRNSCLLPRVRLPVSFGLDGIHLALWQLAKGQGIGEEMRLATLRVKHVVGLDCIADDWAAAVNMHPNILLRIWARALFPVDNRPNEDQRPDNVRRSFRRVAQNSGAVTRYGFNPHAPALETEVSMRMRTKKPKHKADKACISPLHLTPRPPARFIH